MSSSFSASIVAFFLTKTLAPGLRGPNGSTPLKMLLARPSQKLRKLKTALIIVGALRGSTCRVLPNAVWKIGSTVLLQTSFVRFGLFGVSSSAKASGRVRRNAEPKVPEEDTTSPLS
jgi:hypothetical protein